MFHSAVSVCRADNRFVIIFFFFFASLSLHLRRMHFVAKSLFKYSFYIYFAYISNFSRFVGIILPNTNDEYEYMFMEMNTLLADSAQNSIRSIRWQPVNRMRIINFRNFIRISKMLMGNSVHRLCLVLLL